MTWQLSAGFPPATASDFAAARAYAPASYRTEIDGLRAVAVGCVVVAHAFPGALLGGFVGVDVFFVISGYLITSILLREFAQGEFSLARFYMRRALRLFPVLLVSMAAVTAAGAAFLYQPEFRALGGHVLASALFSENLKLSGEVSYFDVGAEAKPTLNLWSLAIEEQFYLLWPLALAILHRRGLAPALVFAALAAASFLAGELQLRIAPGMVYYATSARAWELILGAMLAERAARGIDLAAKWREAAAALGLILIALSALTLSPAQPFPGLSALPPTLGAALVLAAGEGARVNAVALASPAMAALGRISYPLYLWHWPVLSFAHILFGKLPPAGAAACVALSLALAALSYRYIEQPLRRSGVTPFVKAGALVLGMAALALTGALIQAGVAPSRLSRFDAPNRTEWDFLKARTPDFVSNGEGVYVLAPERREKVLLIGDSHLAQYAERLDRDIAADPARPGAVLAVGGGCAPLLGVTTPDPQRAGCAPLEARAWALARDGGFSTLVVGAAWNWYLRYGDFFIDTDAGRARLASPQGEQAALDWLGRRLDEAKAAGLRVVLVLDEPEAAAFAPAAWPLRFSTGPTGFPPGASVRIGDDEIALHDLLRAWGGAHGFEIVDPFAAVCAADRCAVTTATGRPIYKDESHFNPAWTLEAAGFIDALATPRQ